MALKRDRFCCQLRCDKCNASRVHVHVDKVGRSKPPPVLTSGFNRLKPSRSICQRVVNTGQYEPLPPWSGTGKEFITKVMIRSVRIKAPRLYTFFPCSTQLSAKFILLINNKMPTILLSAL